MQDGCFNRFLGCFLCGASDTYNEKNDVAFHTFIHFEAFEGVREELGIMIGLFQPREWVPICGGPDAVQRRS